MAAAAELVHGFEAWDWGQLTFRAVAERADVGERTVYRHFPTERHLHDAVMHRLHEEAGVDYEGVTLENLAEVTTRVLDSMARFPTAPTGPQPADAVFADVDRHRRAALARVVAELDVDAEARETIAALLDVLWNLPAFERLVVGWQLDPERGVAGPCLAGGAGPAGGRAGRGAPGALTAGSISDRMLSPIDRGIDAGGPAAGCGDRRDGAHRLR